MKFAIFVLLGLCAVVAHASFDEFEYDFEEPIEARNKITDQIRAKIDELVKKATEEFHTIADKISAMAKKLREQGRDLVMKAKEKIDEARGAIQKKIDEMKKKGGVYAECAKKLEPEYKEVERETRSELKKCAGDVMVSNEEYRRDVGQAVGVIRANLRQIRDMVADCLGWNPIKTTKCIFGEKMDELKKLVNGVATGSRDALRVSRERASAIMAQAKQCNGKALSSASEKVKALNEKLSQCFQNQSEFLLY